MRPLVFLGSLLLLLSLTGCKEPLHSSLSESEANQMIVVLAQSGIDADKITAGDKHWAIQVEKADLPAAIDAIKRAGLPRERFSNLGDMFKREGIVSTPTEERVRFLHGISQELSSTLSTIDGVISARVHIVIPQNDPLADRTTPSSASVFIKHDPGIDLQPLLPSIKSLVLRSVEGLTYETVYVSLFPAAPGPADRLAVLGRAPLGVKTSGTGVPADLINELRQRTVPIVFVIGGVLLLALIWRLFQYRNALRSATELTARFRRETAQRSNVPGSSESSLHSPTSTPLYEQDASHESRHPSSAHV